ncbi:uncharacterized protein BDR25DRAFT_301040 [Lindgomyces ingoldianus]|uniref:Uncharacterized protein n=1 Tax=Lindgomyces ingoldianus TaxID=673940 RepID=A0ACB6R8C0_9PLEO|nr:uncharacterized protein BDR25DRAFT_301040 [Lindgomyces ingoldianus]KAF2475290.1 hypothetical protein BDR25DRAFT_301040 [Lindgomyces ingoldianus]
MKASLILAVVSAAVAMASPAEVSLNRAFRAVTVDGTTTQTACIECPCGNTFNAVCECVPGGCCCT